MRIDLDSFGYVGQGVVVHTMLIREPRAKGRLKESEKGGEGGRNGGKEVEEKKTGEREGGVIDD